MYRRLPDFPGIRVAFHPAPFAEGSEFTTLQKLIAQKKDLDRQIERTKARERSQAIEKVRALG